NNDLLQRMVSGLLAWPCESRGLGRSRYHNHSWLRSHDDLCRLSARDSRLRAGQLLPDLFNMLDLHGELRSGLPDVFLLLYMRKLRTVLPDMFNLHGCLRADLQRMPDLRHACCRCCASAGV